MVMFNCVHAGCAYKTKKAKHLERHQSIHTGERPYACSHPGCSHRASERDHIRTHERRHTGEKPYACPVDDCGYRAARHDAVKLHQRRNHTTMQPICVYEPGEHQGHPCRCLHCASTVSPPGPSTARRRRARSDVDIQSLTSSDDSQSRQHSPSVSTSSSDIGPMFPPIPAPDAIGPRERGRIPTAEPEGYPVQDFEPRSHSGFTPNGRPFAYQYPVIGSSHCPPPSQPYPSPTPRATTRSRHVIERLDVGLGLHGASAHRSRPMYTLPRPTLPALSTQNWYTPYSHHRCPPQPRIPYICRSATPVQRSCSPPCILPPLSSSSSSYASLSQRSMSVEPACTEEATVTMPFPSPPPPPKYRIIRWGPNGRQEGDALS